MTSPTPTVSEALERAKRLKPDWLYFGTLIHTNEHAEQITRGMAESLPGVRCFYDTNLRPGSWNLPLIQRLSELASILKLNQFEA